MLRGLVYDTCRTLPAASLTQAPALTSVSFSAAWKSCEAKQAQGGG